MNTWTAETFAKKLKLTDEADDDIVVIGIDFGTTFSGAAWATVEDFAADQINLITNWPGCGREEGKVPTEIFYENEQIMWGYEVPDDADPVRWFKLLLLREEDLSADLRASEVILRARKMLRDNGKTAIDLTADYLSTIWKHTLENIVRSRGQSVVDALTFHTVITVPAIWKGYAREAMEVAAKRAGILDRRTAGETKLSFVPEPEAAAFSTMCEPGRKIRAGEVYMICDAGGGTVDLISYKIDGVDPITLSEAVEGKGGLCGGVFVDEEFERMCSQRLKRQWSKLSKTGIKDIMKREWEYGIKPQFKPGNSSKEYIVAIPAEAFGKTGLNDLSMEPLIKNGRIHFKSSHIQSVFKDSFAGIDKLIDEQIRSAAQQGLRITGIILVGGLGASPYLYEYLKDRHSFRNIETLQSGGIKPRTAICRGAVFKGFIDGFISGDVKSDLQNGSGAPISVSSTIARASFGTSHFAPWDDGTHDPEDMFWQEDEEAYFAQNQMKWYINKGDNVSKTIPVKHYFYYLYRSYPGPTLSVTLYSCEKPTPPSRRDADMKLLCHITGTHDVPYSTWEDFTSPSGQKLKKLNFEIEMIPSGASLEFVVHVQGQRLTGGTTVSYQ